MSERMDQARAEAVREAAQYIERLHPKGLTPKRAVIADLEIAADRMGRGIHANGREREADANPQPRTITLAQSEAILEAGRTGRYEDHEAALRAAGVEVEYDDE